MSHLHSFVESVVAVVSILPAYASFLLMALVVQVPTIYPTLQLVWEPLPWEERDVAFANQLNQLTLALWEL